MSSQAFQIFAFILFLLLSFFPHLNMSSRVLILKHNAIAHDMNSSFSLSFNNLRGCRLGDTAQGIHRLKKYLRRFGYITNVEKNSMAMDDDTFDHALESAVKTYQKNYNIDASGILDAKTITQMRTPRCGVQDFFNGTTWMRSSMDHKNRDGRFHTVSHYSFFGGKPKWPASKFHLSYAFLPGYPSEAIEPVDRAFSKWASETHFTFSKISNYKKSDIKISFEIEDHGDFASFDGMGGILAHAFPPTDGRLHFDAHEPWSVGALSGYFDVETVALHEIGHLLGLQHSSIEAAIMYPTIPEGDTKDLHGDDVAGLKALYGI
ncbi:metalloendoproteinase 3-MMP-like [Momordica charantia]|uniref:Metalloendoproteinase 1-like n=1 Tax=Momordica charantia TaxID=3673 RepID=A0A0H4TG97_MOMCH|nr:metalloendoproteinase 3-MMP-like [Momordica charantia]AKQ06192.1 metalloendoproteinase 1-like precursor [Momordica charantia]